MSHTFSFLTGDAKAPGENVLNEADECFIQKNQKVYFTTHHSARNPSFHPIFFPSL
jgi:hypothetical protein